MYEAEQTQAPKAQARDSMFVNDSEDRTRLPQFAPVIPIEIASQLPEEVLGGYHLLLAHDVLERPDDYKNIYADKGWTIMMDNSLVELGYPLSMRETLDAAKVVGAQYIILPDVMGDYEGTVAATNEALTEWYNLSQEDRSNVQLLYVIQGKHYGEHMSCVLQFTHREDIAGACVPRIIADTCGTRKHVVELATKCSRVHLLGFSENLWDDVACARMPRVNGIDSAVPIRLGMQGRTLSFDQPKDAGKRGDFWDNPWRYERAGTVLMERDSLLATAIRNIRDFRKAITF